MDIHKLRCVVSLARLGNVTLAARENFIAQSTMSSTISSVENELGVVLFSRTNRGVTPTEAGKRFAAAAEDILRKYDQAVSELVSSEACLQPVLTIGFNSISVGAEIGDFMQYFMKRHSHITFRLCKQSLSRLTQDLVDEKIDIVFGNQFEARKKPSLRFAPIAQSFPCVYVPKGHPLAKRSSITVDDLRGETLFCARSDGDPDEMSAAAKVLRDGGVPFTKESLAENEEAIASMVEAGLGVYPASDWYRRALEGLADCVSLELNVESMTIGVLWKDPALDDIARDLACCAKKLLVQDV